jgi:hypothetical protein
MMSLTSKELGRRFAAARGYTRLPLKTFAKQKVKIDRGTVSNYEGGNIHPLKRSGLIERYAKSTTLPPEFFVIDFDDLPKMVEHWRQVTGSAEGEGEGDGLSGETADQDLGPRGDADGDAVPPEEDTAADA